MRKRERESEGERKGEVRGKEKQEGQRGVHRDRGESRIERAGKREEER